MNTLTEKDITKVIRNYLKLNRVFHWKVHQGLGSTPGVSDILGLYRGFALAIEVKREKGKLSGDQQRFLDNWRDEGGIGIVARSLDDVHEGLVSEYKRVSEMRNNQQPLRKQMTIW